MSNTIWNSSLHVACILEVYHIFRLSDDAANTYKTKWMSIGFPHLLSNKAGDSFFSMRAFSIPPGPGTRWKWQGSWKFGERGARHPTAGLNFVVHTWLVLFLNETTELTFPRSYLLHFMKWNAIEFNKWKGAIIRNVFLKKNVSFVSAFYFRAQNFNKT